ncbi:VCBS repeat-containing protein [Streptomyces sp. NPDC089919]|uniref:FG-GAP repeat domain-containing protein n=1 Tax=Streptomyces sp. NPDC089919 TaxID=3155188 RepID=UPI0034476640
MSSRSQRLRRHAACTALAVIAGTMLSAGPATALARPAGTTAAGAALGPRADLNQDRRGDLLIRTPWGTARALTETDGSSKGYTYALHGEGTRSARDVLALGDVRGGGGTELLLWSADGHLAMSQAGAHSSQAPTWTGTGWQRYDKLVAVNDVTGDGRGDLLARTPAGTLYLYRTTGSATGNPFAAAVRVGTGWGQYDQLVGANDLDADGRADLIAKSPDGRLYYYEGTGRAAAPFKARTLVGGGWNAYSKIIASDNFGRNKAGLLAVTPEGVLYFYPGKGHGAFEPRLRFGAPTSVIPPWNTADVFVNSGVTPVYGKHGVDAVDASGAVREYTGLTDGHFLPVHPALDKKLPAGRTLVSAAAVTADNRPTRYSWNGSALTELLTGKAVKGSFAGTRTVVGPGDLTGDGKGDLLTRDSRGTLWLRAGTGSPTEFAKPVKVGPGWGGYRQIVGAGDMSGDGRADLVATDAAGQLFRYRGTGRADAPFSARESVGGGWKAYDTLAAPGDLNGDGRADLLARDAAGTLWLHRSTGLTGSKAFAGRSVVEKGWSASVYRQFN